MRRAGVSHIGTDSASYFGDQGRRALQDFGSETANSKRQAPIAWPSCGTLRLAAALQYASSLSLPLSRLEESSAGMSSVVAPNSGCPCRHRIRSSGSKYPSTGQDGLDANNTAPGGSTCTSSKWKYIRQTVSASRVPPESRRNSSRPRAVSCVETQPTSGPAATIFGKQVSFHRTRWTRRQ
jgi:hypothetical protein